LADSTKIHEVILNLVTNAIYAMEQKGRLTVRLYSEFFQQETHVQTGELVQGEYTVIEVGDTGCGMDSQIIAKAFEPFFTTKGVGEGTGMGLSVVLGVVRSHNGHIQIESIVGEGTTFKIYFPITENSVPVVESKNVKTPVFGNERILFVDDERMLVEMAQDALTHLGFIVTGMSSSREALEFIKVNGAEIDILITDQTMPGMSGIELSIDALKIRKDLPIILCTGFSNVVTPESARAAGVSRFVIKPYNSYEIGKLIREIFDNKKESGDGKNSGN
jgi:CheY-like chemotaxis protein